MEEPMTAVRDYYYILGVSSNATSKQIQTAYDELYAKFGPHVSAEELDPDATLKACNDICEAYAVLMDPVRRREYDKKAEMTRQTSAELRNLWMRKTGVLPALEDDLPPQKENKDIHTVSEFIRPKEQKETGAAGESHHLGQPKDRRQSGQFRSYHSQPNGQKEPEQFHNPHSQPVDQRESSQFRNQRGESDFQETLPCATENEQPAQHGNTFEAEVTVTLKEACKGARKEVRLSDPTPCDDCAGLIPVLRLQCAICRGAGSYNVERVEEVDLPAGLYDGMEIDLPGRGSYDPRTGQRHDLLIKIRLSPHPFLSVNGKNITCTVPVTLYEALLGAEIEAPCATGKVTMKIQALTQPGRVYRLKGLGLGGADQLVTIELALPTRLSGDEVALLKKLKEMYKEPNPREAFFNK